MKCDGCGKRVSMKAVNAGYSVNGRRISGVYVCPHCGAVLGQCYKGDSFSIVKPYFSPTANAVESPVYFDLSVLGSNGVERRHGWFNPADRCLVQVG